MTRHKFLTLIRTAALFFAAAGLLAAVQFGPPFGSWKRLSREPVLSPQGTGFESAGTFNPAVVEKDGKIVMLYRAQDQKGTLLVYNGADDHLVYSTGWVLFDKTDPTKVIARADKPVFHPVESWEKIGQVPNVVFVEGLVRRGSRWLFYYGGADKTVGAAVADSLQR